MSETPIETNAAPNSVALNWLKLLDVTIGEEVMILPVAGQPGQGLQGALVDMAVGPNGPIAVMIRRSADTQVVCVPWSAIMMITRPTTPPVAMPDAPPTDITVAEVVAMAEKMGMAVPAKIQEMADAETS